MADGAALAIDLEAFELPLAIKPKTQPPLISLQLILEEGDVVFDHVQLPGGGQLRQAFPHALEKLVLEADHVPIHTYPVACIRGVQSLGVLALEQTVSR